jgi:hypothetical protein
MRRALDRFANSRADARSVGGGPADKIVAAMTRSPRSDGVCLNVTPRGVGMEVFPSA